MFCDLVLVSSDWTTSRVWDCHRDVLGQSDELSRGRRIVLRFIWSHMKMAEQLKWLGKFVGAEKLFLCAKFSIFPEDGW